jgi:hypothetical protein
MTEMKWQDFIPQASQMTISGNAEGTITFPYTGPCEIEPDGDDVIFHPHDIERVHSPHDELMHFQVCRKCDHAELIRDQQILCLTTKQLLPNWASPSVPYAGAPQEEGEGHEDLSEDVGE